MSHAVRAALRERLALRWLYRAVLAAVALGVVALAAASPLLAAEPEQGVRRFALVASSNDGGKDRVRLRFAETDALSMSEVLQHLGGVRRQDVVLLPNATEASLGAAFAALQQRLADGAGGHTRRELFVYYSGHSDELGLLLGGTHVPYRRMREWIDATGADVRIAVLDSCASGAVIRERGGVRRPPFLSDVSVQARGHAFLTASSADEAAQESDRIRGGFFTHYFLSGLRGAADMSRDGRVTLAEAYQFSYNETLRRTEQSGAGAQHPAYDIQLAGTGDLVLTDLRDTSAGLTLEDGLAGRVFVRNEAGRLMVELSKEPAYPVRLGLAPGKYRVTLDRSGKSYEALVLLEEGRQVRLDQAGFSDVPAELASVRGSPAAEPAHAAAAEPGRDEPKPSALIDLDLGVTIGGYAGVDFRYARLANKDALLAGAELALLLQHRFAIGLGGYGGDPEPEGSISFGYGGAIVRYHFLFESSPFYFSIAALAGAGAVHDKSAGEDAISDTVFVFEPQLSGHVNLTRWLRMGVDVGHRFVSGAETFRGSDFDGIMAGYHVHLGWF